MRYYTLLLALLIQTSPYAQTVNQDWIDHSGNVKLLGEITSKRLKQQPFRSWYKPNYQGYEPEEAILPELAERINSIDSIKIFMGTWCGDSKMGVPAVLKLLDRANYNTDKVTIIAVDNVFNNYKQSPGGEEKGLNIHRVPTILSYQDGLELGRIVESPKDSWEKDLLNILNESYEPNYEGVSHIHGILDNLDLQEPVAEELVTSLKDKIASRYELNTYGYQLLSSWKFEEAIFVFELNTLIFQSDPFVHFKLAKVHNLLGQESKTLDCLNMVLALDPAHKEAAELLKIVKS